MLSLTNRYAIYFIVVLVFCVGCTPREPFVYYQQEFNRDAPTFGKKRINITKIRICYSKISTTSKKITLFEDANAIAPPEPPSPIMTEIFGTVKDMQHSIELAIADA